MLELLGPAAVLITLLLQGCLGAKTASDRTASHRDRVHKPLSPTLPSASLCTDTCSRGPSEEVGHRAQ